MGGEELDLPGGKRDSGWANSRSSAYNESFEPTPLRGPAQLQR